MSDASLFSFDHFMSFWSGRSASKHRRPLLMVNLMSECEFSPSILILSVKALSFRRLCPLMSIHSISMLHDLDPAWIGVYSLLSHEDNMRAEISAMTLIPMNVFFISQSVILLLDRILNHLSAMRREIAIFVDELSLPFEPVIPTKSLTSLALSGRDIGEKEIFTVLSLTFVSV